MRDVPLKGKTVLVRVDFNVPLDSTGQVTEDTRIRAALPTIQYALDQQARMVVASHLGRPKGNAVPELSLSPVADCLSRLMKRDVAMAPDCVGPEVSAMVSRLNTGDILMLENLRFHPEETENDDGFAQNLASLCDIYVNDAFAVSHRHNASVDAIAKYADMSIAGFLLKNELDTFSRMVADARHPLIAVVGGSKVSSKLEALMNMLSTVDTFIVGGAMANTFLKAAGVDVGRSRIEADLIPAASEIMKQAAERKIRFYLPVDAVVSTTMTAESEASPAPVQEIPEDCMALDIGPATAVLFAEALNRAETIIWNGPMGVFEIDAYAQGTDAMAKAVARSSATTIAGGGDTDAAIRRSGTSDKMTYISTGGGAFLALLEGKTLPGVRALMR